MDEHHVHDFWGLSPPLDLLKLAESRADATPTRSSVQLLQVCPYDPRHCLETICHLPRHDVPLETDVVLMVYEEQPEALARHIILLAIFLDSEVPSHERMQRFLEVFGNALLRQDTLAYLREICNQVEATLTGLLAGRMPDSRLGRLVDVSLLTFHARDDVLSAVVNVRSKAECDMIPLWDARCRRWYRDRYDFRRNMIDWDYHMRLVPAGTPCTSGPGCIIHFYHFRHWRLTGIAYEVRECNYNMPNRTLMSCAYGRTREFKDRYAVRIPISNHNQSAHLMLPAVRPFELSGAHHVLCELRHSSAMHTRGFPGLRARSTDTDRQMITNSNPIKSRHGEDVGRSVSAVGLWCDILNGPYHSFGTACEDESYYAKSNKEFKFTSIDVSERNVLALMHELETGNPLPQATAKTAHRAKAARGPTDMQSLGCDGNKSSSSGAGEQGRSLSENQCCGEVPSNLRLATGNAKHQLGRVTLRLMSGEFSKQVTGKRKFARLFAAVTVGCRHTHLVRQGISRVVEAGAIVAVETPKYVVNLSADNVSDALSQLDAWAAEGGLTRTECADVHDSHRTFCSCGL